MKLKRENALIMGPAGGLGESIVEEVAPERASVSMAVFMPVAF